MPQTMLQSRAKEVLKSFDIIKKTRNEIDSEKWDRCVHDATNESPLALSWVLDQLTPGWEGLVIGNYQGVMPLPHSRTMGFRMIQMPHEVLTLGLFSSNPEIVALFPYIFYHPQLSPFRFISYSGSPTDSSIIQSPEVSTKFTYELELNKPYENLYRNYSRNHRRSISNFQESGLRISEDNHGTNFTRLTAEIGKTRPELFMDPGYRKKFDAMTTKALEKKQGSAYSVWENNQLIGAAFFLRGNKRCIPYHMVNEKGRQTKAVFALIDHFIRLHAGEPLIIDFAGSVIPNVAAFNRRFGASQVPYASVKINRLPPLIKLAKEKNLIFRMKRAFLR